MTVLPCLLIHPHLSLFLTTANPPEKLFAKSYIALMLLLFYAPIFVLIAYSFTDSDSLGVWNGFTLDLYKNVFKNEMLDADDFLTEFNKKVFSALKDAYENGEYSGIDFNSGFTSEEVGRITKMRVARMSLSENGPSILNESILSLKNAVQKKSAETISTLDELNKLIKNRQNQN